ncbi:ribosomal protein [Synechococcus sp. RS9917]|nr:ribosomal protein [Synechococcus sp. RS9917]
MNLVFTGSLYCARRMASRAMDSVISAPPISNSTRPGLITATQNSGLPLPEPMRVSAGRIVIGLSGKIRIQILPPRLTWRVMARRLASIWREVIQPHSWACSAN